jgi:IS5 family transposase
MMRQTFDSDTPREVALARAKARRNVGRKHNHQPRGRALERRYRAKLIRARQRELARIAFSAKVAAYFRGDVENYPA